MSNKGTKSKDGGTSQGACDSITVKPLPLLNNRQTATSFEPCDKIGLSFNLLMIFWNS